MVGKRCSCKGDRKGVRKGVCEGVRKGGRNGGQKGEYMFCKMIDNNNMSYIPYNSLYDRIYSTNILYIYHT